MTNTSPYTRIRPADVFSVIPEIPAGRRANEIPAGDWVEVRPTNIELLDVFMQLLRRHGNMQVRRYATMLGLDSRLLTCTFIALTGMGAHEWIVEYLSTLSCVLLERTTRPIGEIARLTGFPSESTFSQFFVRTQKCPPWQWRNRRKHHYVDGARPHR
jgi:AraC-like DNA-binding protein